MRKPVMAGNWKMNGSIEHSKDFIDNFSVEEEFIEKNEIIICPPSTLLAFWNDYGKKKLPYIKIGAQNCYWEPKGAYTGELSVGMLKEAGCYCCIIGHSERRAYFGETDENVNKKMNALMDAGIVPIVCVGETLEQREADKTKEVVLGQVMGSVIASKDRDLKGVIIAYEPVWAIGTGKTATNEQAEEVCSMIRALLKEELGQEAAEAIRIQYGGSVNVGNVDDLMAQPNIDGGLVGGASLKAADFSRLASFIEK